MYNREFKVKRIISKEEKLERAMVKEAYKRKEISINERIDREFEIFEKYLNY